MRNIYRTRPHSKFNQPFRQMSSLNTEGGKNSFVKEIQRIVQNDYLPTDADILKLGGTTPAKSGVQTHKFTKGSLSLHIFDIGSQGPEREKWIHQFEGAISIVFFVDLSRYGEVLLEESDQNRIEESLLLFSAVANSHWFRRATIILLLCNVEQFREKLRIKPLSNYFPDYSGGDDINRASKYLFQRFGQVNRARLNTFPTLCDLSDDSSTRFVWSAVKYNILIYENLASSLI